MKRLRAIWERHQPILAPAVPLGMIVLTTAGAEFLARQNLAPWIGWAIGVPWCLGMGLVVTLMMPPDLEDDDER